MNGSDAPPSASASERTWSPIVEFRQYTLHPGKRDVLIDLFDSRFVEPQEHLGMAVIGQFRDLGNPNKFVWLRGFPDMSERARSLANFYDGPVWQSNRDTANGTMVDPDDVLLLRPARHNSAFRPAGDRPPLGIDGDVDRGVVEATILHLDAPASMRVCALFEREIAPAIKQMGASILAYFVTEASPNSFPRLPIREGEHVFVWFAGFPDRVSYERHPRDHTAVTKTVALVAGLERSPQVLRLSPTSRSSLTGSSRPCLAV